MFGTMNDIASIIANIFLTIIIGIMGYISKQKNEEQKQAIKEIKVKSDTVEKRIINIFNDIKNQFNITIENDTRKVEQMLKDFASLKAHLNERVGTQIQLDLDVKQCMILISRCESKLEQHSQIIKSHHARVNELNKRLDIIMPPSHSSK